MSTVIVERAGPEQRAPWHLGMAHAKLQVRGRLPGAFGFDLAAASYREARRAGLGPAALLPMALPGSWMVNNKVPSPVFYRWLQPHNRELWAQLVELLDGDGERWLARDEDERTSVETAVRRLAAQDAAARTGAADGPAPGTAAGLSKVLALLCPDSVPLMDDAAIHFALGTVARPDSADTPSAGPEHFLPMLDWFARAVGSARPALAQLADEYQLAPLSPAQVLDRLLWFETWGYRVCRSPSPWWCVGDRSRAAVVPMPVPQPPFAASVRPAGRDPRPHLARDGARGPRRHLRPPHDVTSPKPGGADLVERRDPGSIRRDPPGEHHLAVPVGIEVRDAGHLGIAVLAVERARGVEARQRAGLDEQQSASACTNMRLGG
jgi:hypothetical protein